LDVVSVVPGQGEAALNGEDRDPPATVDLRGAQGVQTGAHGTQYNTYTIKPAPVVPAQVVCGAIPGRPVGFQPRGALLDELAAVAGSARVAVVCALTGQRGVGKTQLAAAYARRMIEEKCPLVAWVDAERPDTILSGLDAVATALGLRQEGEDATTGLARLMSHLQTRDEPALLVFDNVTNPDHVVGYLPATGPTQIIFTSTQQDVHNLGQTVAVEVYTHDEARDFLHTATGLADDVGAAELAEELGRLPLALTHAAAVIRARAIDYPTCAKLIRDFPLPKYLVHQRGQHYPRGTAEAVLLALYEAGVNTDPKLVGLAGVLALLSPNGISRELLTVLTNGDATVLDDQIQCLAGKSVITHIADRSALSMHRLVARVIRDELRAGGTYPILITATQRMLTTAVFPEAQAWQRRQDGDHLIAQIDKLWEHSDLNAQSPLPLEDEVVERLMSLRIWSVRQLTESASGDRAITLATTVHADCQRLLGEEHPDTLTSANNLAEAYQAAERLNQAIPLFKQTLANRRRVLGADHPDTLSSANNLAEAYQAAGRLDKAIPLFKQTLANRRRVLGADHADTLGSANNLANAYRVVELPEQAITLFEQTLTDCQRLLGADHQNTLATANNLANAYQAAGRLDQAIPLFKQTLTDCQRLLGADHPDTLGSANNLANAYQAAGRLDQAIALFEQTLTDCQRLLGTDHSQTLTTANNLAHAYESAGRLKQAIELYEKTLTDCRRVLVAEHRLLQVVAANLQRALTTTGRRPRQRRWRPRAT
jgi:tetratricopeptide (TPR) repeat protein